MNYLLLLRIIYQKLPINGETVRHRVSKDIWHDERWNQCLKRCYTSIRKKDNVIFKTGKELKKHFSKEIIQV